MTASGKLSKQSKRLEGRNGAMYKARLAGCTVPEIAEAFGMSEANVYIKLKQVVASIPPDEQAELRKIRSDFLDQLRQLAMDAALQDPPNCYAPNGRELPILDFKPRLEAIDRLLKVDLQFAKLHGLDSAVAHTVQITAEAQQATKDQADKIEKSFAHLIPESAEVRAHAGSG